MSEAAGPHRAKVTITGEATSANREIAQMAKNMHNLELELQRTKNQFDAQAKKLNDFDDAMRKANDRQKKTSAAFQSVSGSMSSVAGAASKVAGGLGAVVAIGVTAHRVASQLAEEYRQTATVFQNLAFSIQPARDATQGLISDFELAKLQNTLVSTGVDVNARSFADLARGAQVLGARVGIDSTRAMESLSAALARGSSLMLDNLGIVLQESQAQKQYAAQLGTTVSALTDAEKKTAFQQVAIQKILQATQGAKFETDGWVGALGRLDTTLTNMRSSILGAEQRTISLAEGVSKLDERQRKLIDASRQYGASLTEVRSALRDMGVDQDALTGKYQDYIDVLQRVRKEEERRRVDRLLSGDAANDFVASLEKLNRIMQRADNDAQLEQIENLQASFAGVNDQVEYMNDLEAQRAELTIRNLELDGKAEEAAKARRAEELRFMRTAAEGEAREANKRTPAKKKVDPFKDFAEMLGEGRTFGSTSKSEILGPLGLAPAEQDFIRVAQLEQANAQVIDIGEKRIEHELKKAQLLGASAERIAQLEEQLATYELRRRENVRAAMEEELKLRESLAIMDEDQSEILRIQSERERIAHEDSMDRIEQRNAAERRAVAERIAMQRREDAQRKASYQVLQTTTNAANSVMSTGAAFARLIADATIKSEERKARFVEKFQGVQMMVKGASELVLGVADIAGQKYVSGALHLAASALAFTQGGLMLSGHFSSGGSGGGARGSAGGGAGSGFDANHNGDSEPAGARGPTTQPVPRADSNGVPASPPASRQLDPGTTPQDDRSGRTFQGGGNVLNFNVNAQVLSREVVRDLAHMANQMARDEGLEFRSGGRR